MIPSKMTDAEFLDWFEKKARAAAAGKSEVSTAVANYARLDKIAGAADLEYWNRVRKEYAVDYRIAPALVFSAVARARARLDTAP